MKRMTIAKLLFWVLVFYYLIYNWIFGWNHKPLTPAEVKCDDIFRIGLYVCMYFYISPIFEWLEKRVAEDKTID